MDSQDGQHPKLAFLVFKDLAATFSHTKTKLPLEK